MKNQGIMVDTMRRCIDNYLERCCKSEIDEREANGELERAGLLNDDEQYPGKPLRDLLDSLRDTDMLPPNITYRSGVWHIKHSRTIIIGMVIFQF